MVDLNAAVQDAHHGFRTAARMVIVGMVLLCGGSKEQAKEVADSEKAKPGGRNNATFRYGMSSV